jgi:hypothetical protein
VALAYLGIMAVTVLLLWSAKEQYSRGADPEMALIDGGALTMWRKSTLALMGFVLVYGGSRAWTLIGPWFSRVAWYDNNYRVICDAAVGVMLSVGALAVMAMAVAQLFTDVDSRGIHRPSWAGGDFIPWSSVTEVSNRGHKESPVPQGEGGQEEGRARPPALL